MVGVLVMGGSDGGTAWQLRPVTVRVRAHAHTHTHTHTHTHNHNHTRTSMHTHTRAQDGTPRPGVNLTKRAPGGPGGPAEEDQASFLLQGPLAPYEKDAPPSITALDCHPVSGSTHTHTHTRTHTSAPSLQQLLARLNPSCLACVPADQKQQAARACTGTKGRGERDREAEPHPFIRGINPRIHSQLHTHAYTHAPPQAKPYEFIAGTDGCDIWEVDKVSALNARGVGGENVRGTFEYVWYG